MREEKGSETQSGARRVGSGPKCKHTQQLTNSDIVANEGKGLCMPLHALGGADDCAVLDGSVVANGDCAQVSPHHCAIPHTGLGVQGHAAHHCGIGSHKGIIHNAGEPE